MLDLCSLAVIRDIQTRYGFSFSKALGQNFLINPTVCPRMAEACGGERCGVLEIGPGIGVLTAQLALRAKKVVAVELDKRLVPVLGETLAEFPHVKVVQGDALKLDLQELIGREFPGMQVSVCANLPYYITSPVIMALLEQRLPLTGITVMVQKEAAARITAAPGTRQCGAISAAIHYYARPETLFAVSRGSFMPPPEVDSAVIRLTLREKPAVAVSDEALFFSVVRGAFSMRRKTVLNCLSAAFRLSKEPLKLAMEGVGVAPASRAEQLTLPQLAALTEAVQGLLPQKGGE